MIRHTRNSIYLNYMVEDNYKLKFMIKTTELKSDVKLESNINWFQCKNYYLHSKNYYYCTYYRIKQNISPLQDQSRLSCHFFFPAKVKTLCNLHFHCDPFQNYQAF